VKACIREDAGFLIFSELEDLQVLNGDILLKKGANCRIVLLICVARHLILINRVMTSSGLTGGNNG
jgi:hypothetical protein